ncbi:hypothetical protein KUTeg_018496 [Tegillarca granosa]|uniref:Uncharacterized protein n=1 Tax=Tegillarca granosa TaxID=220873 RepID=A0ABQ9EI17_TEGGR|nr:hypothetical protein KUTeg_018496 [Tegillarca granosa]
MTVDMLIDLCNIFESSTDILIHFSSLKCSDVPVQDSYLCLKINRSKTDLYRHGDQVFVSKGNNVARPNNIFPKYVSVTGLEIDSDQFGGATAAANSNINDHCGKRHGRWKTDPSKDGYIVDSVDKRLQVSHVLG